MDISTCVTDEDFEAWRQVRIEVLPGERCDTVQEMREQDSPDRLLVIARLDGEVVGSGVAARSETAGGAYAAPRVRPAFRRRGVGTALFDRLEQHAASLGVPALRGMVDDDGSLAFATRLGFAEVDRQVEQVRRVADEPEPAGLTGDVEVITLDQQPELWSASFDTFGTEVLADFAVFEPLEVTAEQWAGPSWTGDPMFLALHDGAVIGCAGLHRDTDQPQRAENALTAVRRTWRGHGVAAHLKRLTLHWAAEHGISEIYTWTQANNLPMLRLNEHLGYVRGQTSITVSRPF
ncbi:MAG: GNAT family N-acetyltransferase [Nocardioides sp.]